MLVEYLRRKMIRTADEKGSFSHPDVIAISQKLDMYLVQAQRAAALALSGVQNAQVNQASNSGQQVTSKPTRTLPLTSRSRVVRDFRLTPSVVRQRPQL